MTVEYDQPGKLLTTTVELLKDKDLLTVYTETGLPFYWLRSLLSTKAPKNPSVNRIQYLYEYLSGNRLGV